MNKFGLDNWEDFREHDKSAFILKHIGKKSLWYSMVFGGVCILAAWHQDNTSAFGAQPGFMLWAFAGAVLILGCGDGFYLWMMRDREYERKLHSVEVKLVQRARRLQEAHTKNLINLEEKCAELEPLIKMTLTKEACCLAGRTGVCQQAAMLALANQFELDW